MINLSSKPTAATSVGDGTVRTRKCRKTANNCKLVYGVEISLILLVILPTLAVYFFTKEK